jgi:diacylglycerol kinase family enzyme
MKTSDLCVIFNPVSGRGRAARRLEGLKRAWGGRADFRPTKGPGHAEEMALEAARAGFTTVAAAGGDGTVHEVANGILRAGRPKVIFGVVPLGSANDYLYSLNHEEGRDGNPNGVRNADVGVVEAPSGRRRYFVNSLGLGLNGAVTLESRKIRRLQGLALYGLATLRALWYHYECPLMTLRLNGDEWQAPTLLLSVGLGKKEGGFVLAPQAKLADGLFEYLHAGALSRWEILRFLPRLASAGPPTDHSKVRAGQCRQVDLRSASPLTVHVDGEFFSLPEDNLRDIRIRMLPGALRVQPMQPPERGA